MSIPFLKALLLLWVTAVPIPDDHACDGKLVGAACRAQLSDGEHDGVCLAIPGEAALSCMPAPPPAPLQPSP